MNTVLWIVILTAIAGIGGTGLGGAIAATIKKDSSKTVSLFLSFAAGVMLSVVCFDLITSAIHPNGAENDINIFIVIGGILLGYGVIFLLNFFIDKATNHEVKHIDDEHPETADNLDELIHSNHLSVHRALNSKYQLFIAGVVMACAIALHNLPEGMVIGATYASEPAGVLYSGSGLALGIVIGLHNIPEGMAVSVPLISGGMKRWRAILMTALSGAPTVLGAVLGYYVGMIGPVALSLSLSFASGAMLYVIFGELLPESILMWRSKIPAFMMLIGVLIGLVIIYL